MASREVISLQFGHEANFVGAHFWNIQEAAFCFDDRSLGGLEPSEQLNHDVLFRVGRNAIGQETFTPRLLLFDLKGSLRSLPETGGPLYSEPQTDAVMWDHAVALHRAPEGPKSEFLRDGEEEKEEEPPDETAASASDPTPVIDPEEAVEVWSDFLDTQLHPRSLTIVRDFCHGGDSFEHCLQGRALFSSGCALRDDFEEEGLRRFAEECDFLQGFQLLADAAGGFSGMATGALEHLSEEFPSRARLAFPLLLNEAIFRPGPARPGRLLSLAMTLTSFAGSGAACCPLGIVQRPWRSEEAPQRLFESSATLAAGLDCLSVACRTRHADPLPLGALAAAAGPGRGPLALCLAHPFPSGPLQQVLADSGPAQLLASLSPLVSAPSAGHGGLLGLRGAPGDPSDLLRAYARNHFGSSTAVFACAVRQTLPRHFPKLQSHAERSVSAAVSLQRPPSSGQALQELQSLLRALPLRKCLPEAAADVMQLDDVKEELERFAELCEACVESG